MAGIIHYITKYLKQYFAGTTEHSTGNIRAAWPSSPCAAAQIIQQDVQAASLQTTGRLAMLTGSRNYLNYPQIIETMGLGSVDTGARLYKTKNYERLPHPQKTNKAINNPEF